MGRRKILAIVFECNHCPVSQIYEGRIKKLYDVQVVTFWSTKCANCADTFHISKPPTACIASARSPSLQ